MQSRITIGREHESGRTGKGGSILSKVFPVEVSSSSSLAISPFLLFFFFRLGASSSETSAETSPPYSNGSVSCDAKPSELQQMESSPFLSLVLVLRLTTLAVCPSMCS